MNFVRDFGLGWPLLWSICNQFAGAALVSYPFHTFSYYLKQSPPVSEKVILTAAHCIQDKSQDDPTEPQSSAFIVGKHDLNSRSEKGFQLNTIEKFVMHSNWNPLSPLYDADIAVAILFRPITYTKYIKPICLGPARPNQKLEGRNGVVAGWGYLSDTNLKIGQPRIVEVPIISRDECIRSESNFKFIMTGRGFCTAGNLGRGPCKGIFFYPYKFCLLKSIHLNGRLRFCVGNKTEG